MLETARRWLGLFACAFTMAACSDATGAGVDAGATVDASRDAGEGAEGLHRTEAGWVLRTPPLALDPGEERFVCYAVSAPERLAIGAFRSEDNPIVHHFLLVEALAAEPEGLTECDTLFRLTWAPMYAATTATSEVAIPEGAAKIVEAGAQMVLQVHVLNTSTEATTNAVEVALQDARAEEPVPVGITLFGDANVRLSAGAAGTTEHTCTLRDDVSLYALLPHMHYLGRKLEMDVGPDDASLASVYARDPFDFDDQRFDAVEEHLPAGSRVRVRCTFENDTGHVVKFGETAHDEMCFAVAFRVGGPPLELCTNIPELIAEGGVPRDQDAGVCGEWENPRGVGRVCTAGGGECPEDLFCAADLAGVPEAFCFEVGCMATSECGEGTTCCTLPELGTVANLCITEACRPDFCIPVEMQ